MKKLAVALFSSAAAWRARRPVMLRAQEAAPPAPTQLGEVVVSGQSLEETLARGARPVRHARRHGHGDAGPQRRLHRRRAEPGDARAGLYISPKNGPFDYVDISLLGSRTQDVLWLLDGVRLNNRLYGGTTPLDTFPASLVERLEILDGPQSLFYGTQAIAGAVNIVTRSFSDDARRRAGAGRRQQRRAPPGRLLPRRHRAASLRDLRLGRRIERLSAVSRAGLSAERDRSPPRLRRADAGRRSTATSVTQRPAGSAPSYQHTDATLDFAQPFLTATAFNQRDEDILTAKVDYAPSDTLAVLRQGLRPLVALALHRVRQRRRHARHVERHRRPRLLGLPRLRRQRRRQGVGRALVRRLRRLRLSDLRRQRRRAGDRRQERAGARVLRAAALARGVAPPASSPPAPATTLPSVRAQRRGLERHRPVQLQSSRCSCAAPPRPRSACRPPRSCSPTIPTTSAAIPT